MGPEISATQLPAISSAEAPQGHNAAPTIANIAIQRMGIVIVLLKLLGSSSRAATDSRQDMSGVPSICTAVSKHRKKS
jgi:hypothetical protein